MWMYCRKKLKIVFYMAIFIACFASFAQSAAHWVSKYFTHDSDSSATDKPSDAVDETAPDAADKPSDAVDEAAPDAADKASDAVDEAAPDAADKASDVGE
ncbi:hypothetical protein AT240_03100 [Bartonella henselae]|nr:hypothetical protein AT240_03100 [Bartonella henselae]